MKWEASAIRVSASRSRALVDSASPWLAARRAVASSANTSTGASLRRRASLRIFVTRVGASATASVASSAARRHSPRSACSPPPAWRCQETVFSKAENGLRPCDPDLAEPGPSEYGQRRHAHVTDGFGHFDGANQRRHTGLTIAGQALGPAEAGGLICLGLRVGPATAHLGRPQKMGDRITEPVLEPGHSSDLPSPPIPL